MTATRRNLLIYLISVLVAFGVGAGWQFTRASAAREQTRAAEQSNAALTADLAQARLESKLAAATIAAQLGSYERGRVFASEFFTELQTRVDSMPVDASGRLRELLERRDVTITALSRADPAIADELARLFVRFRSATGGDPGIIEMTPPPDTSGTGGM